MENLLKAVLLCRFENIPIAIITCVLTGILKLPVKALAEKFKNTHAITRFLVFLPLAISFGITMLFGIFIEHGLNFDGEFFSIWLSSASLSLAIYAFWEKLVPLGKSGLTNSVLEESKDLVETLKNTFKEENQPQSKIDNQKEVSTQNKRIILKNNKNKKGE